MLLCKKKVQVQSSRQFTAFAVLVVPLLLAFDCAAADMVGLNYMVYIQQDNPFNPYIQGATVGVNIPGVNKTQNVYVDSGSSSLVFCNGTNSGGDTIDPIVENYLLPQNVVQMNFYNTPSADPTVVPKCDGFNEFLYGHMYKSNINFAGLNDALVIKDALYTVADHTQGMPCNFGVDGVDGIFGVAHESLNSAYVLPEGTLVSDLSTVQCEQNISGVVYEFLESNTSSATKITVTPPLKKILVDTSRTHGDNNYNMFGIFFDYNAAMVAIAGKEEAKETIDDLGTLYFGKAAKNNDYYNGGGDKQVVPAPIEGIPVGFYGFTLLSIETDDGNFTQPFSLEFCKEGSACYFDSGTTTLQIPIEEKYCDGTITSFDNLKFNLEGLNNQTVTLTIPRSFLVEHNKKWVSCTGKPNSTTSNEMIFGFPTYQFYYILYNMGDQTVTVVDLPATNVFDTPAMNPTASPVYNMGNQTVTVVDDLPATNEKRSMNPTASPDSSSARALWGANGVPYFSAAVMLLLVLNK